MSIDWSMIYRDTYETSKEAREMVTYRVSLRLRLLANASLDRESSISRIKTNWTVANGRSRIHCFKTTYLFEIEKEKKKSGDLRAVRLGKVDRLCISSHGVLNCINYRCARNERTSMRSPWGCLAAVTSYN